MYGAVFVLPASDHTLSAERAGCAMRLVRANIPRTGEILPGIVRH